MVWLQVLNAIEVLSTPQATTDGTVSPADGHAVARSAIEKLATEAPENVELWAKLAAAALRQGLPSPAVCAARGALKLDAAQRGESLAREARSFASGAVITPFHL